MILKKYRHYRTGLLIGLCSLNGLFGCVTTRQELAIERHGSELNWLCTKMKKNFSTRHITTITGLIVASVVAVGMVARAMHCIPDFITRASRIHSNISHSNRLAIGRPLMHSKNNDYITPRSYISSTEERSIVNAIQKNPGDLVIDDTPDYSVRLADPMVLDDQVLQNLIASHFSIKKIKFYLAQGLNINAIDQHLGNTLLMYVASYGHKNSLQFMIDKEANVNAKNKNGYTALHLAINFGRVKLAKYLVQTKGIDLNAVDKNKRAPLHLAARKGYRSIVKAILCSKSNLNVKQKDKNGNTPLQIAKKSKHPSIAKLLRLFNQLYAKRHLLQVRDVKLVGTL